VYVEPLDLEPSDETFSPTKKAYGLFDHGIIREPHGRTTAYAMVTNGALRLNTAEQVKNTGIAGEATLPTVLVYDDEVVQHKIEMISDILFEHKETAEEVRAVALKDPTFEPFEKQIILSLRNVHDLFGGVLIGNMADKDEQTLQDIVTRTGSLPPDFGLVVQKESNGYLTITGDQQNMMLAMNAFQANFTELQRLRLPQPRIAPIGYGFLTRKSADEPNWRVKKRPGTKMQLFGTDEYLKFSIREDPYNRFPERMQAFVTACIACCLRKYLPVTDYTFNDRVAFLGTLLLLYTGSSDISVKTTWQFDGYMSALRMVGTGESLAYRLNPNTIESALDRFFLEVILGWLFQTYKGTTSMATIYPGGKTYANKLIADFNIFLQPQLPGVGSGSMPYFIPASNEMRQDVPMPMLVRENQTSDVHILPRPTNIKFETADVVMGKVPKGVASQVSTDEVWYRWRVAPDAEGVVLDRFMRHLIQFRWPWWHLVDGAATAGVAEEDRYFVWMMNWLYTESTVLKDGTLILPGLGIVPWAGVSVHLNSRYELVVEKADTSTVPPKAQEPRPGAETLPPREIPPAKSAEEHTLATSIPGPTTPTVPSAAAETPPQSTGKPAPETAGK